MNVFSDRSYRVIRWIAVALFRIIHPVVKVKGRENIPEGAAILCCNHSAFSDPVWLIGYANLRRLPRTMAKQELMKVPVLGRFFQKLGAIWLNRGANDLLAIKTAMKALREDNKLVIFPEGTRVRHGKKSEPHSGAALLSVRAQAPLVPCYVTAKKRIFGRIDVVYGQPYLPRTSCPKPDNAELEQLSAELLKKIYALGEIK